MLTQMLNAQVAQLEANAMEQVQLDLLAPALLENCNEMQTAIALNISPAVVAHLLETAQQAQAWYEREQGEYYAVLDLTQAFTTWIKSCIEELAADAFEHCISGSRDYAFNRRAFQQAIAQLEQAMLTEPTEAE